MRLAESTDYALRVLMRCAVDPQRRWTVAELAHDLGLSRNHLMKIVQQLGARGWLLNMRGRGGGVQLGVDAGSLTVGEVVRAMEHGFELVECFSSHPVACTFAPRCRLKTALSAALDAYLGALDQISLAQLLTRPRGARVTVMQPLRRRA